MNSNENFCEERETKANGLLKAIREEAMATEERIADLNVQMAPAKPGRVEKLERVAEAARGVVRYSASRYKFYDLEKALKDLDGDAEPA